MSQMRWLDHFHYLPHTYLGSTLVWGLRFAGVLRDDLNLCFFELAAVNQRISMIWIDHDHLNEQDDLI